MEGSSAVRRDEPLGGAARFVSDALDLQEERLRIVLEACSDAVLVVRGGVVLQGNPAAARLFGGAAGALVGRQLVELIESRVLDLLKSEDEGGASSESTPRELVCIRQDGALVPVEAIFTQPANSDPTIRYVFLRDLSERKRLEAALERAACSAAELLARLGGGTGPAPGNASADVAAAILEVARLLALDAGRLEPTRAPPPREAARAGRSAVLVCDDERRLAELTVSLLESMGYDATTAGSVQGVMDALRAGAARFDVLLLDVSLPPGNAGDVLRQMKAEGIRLPVILTSGYAEEDVPAELLADPQVVRYLAKPCAFDRLVETLEEFALERGA
ncbi:MAG: response regulator [Sorangiineae bacterium]|nr:response regulator [Polyangiaceae bacterium]MEB2325206.1 response regulator [Sorangiineae bacterium]